MKLSTGFYLTIFCLMLSACAVVASPTATNTPAATSTVSPTAIPATVTSTPGPTEEPAPTPLPPLVWAKSFSKPIELKGFKGVWSPTANELVGIERRESPEDIQNFAGTLTLHSAPTFAPITLDDEHENVLFNILWTPNGQQIFYGASELPVFFDIDAQIEFFSMKRDGSNRQSLFSSGGPGLWGLIGSNTIIYSDYSGGSHEYFEIYDLLKKKVLASDLVHIVEKEPINGSYIPIVDCLGFCTTCILTTATLKIDENSQSSYSCRSEEGHVRPFPRSEKLYPLEIGTSIDTIFQGWQTSTNTMLILADGRISNKQVSRLLLWSVDTDKVTSLAAGGLLGKLSPDGKMLAYITSGPASQYAGENLQSVSFDPVIPDEKQYLQLMNINTRQIMLSLPVKTDVDPLSFSNTWDMTNPWEISFSPDGRYLLFATDGAVALKDAHFPAEVMMTDTDKVYLNILDIQDAKSIQSLPLEEYKKYRYPQVSWSPNNKEFTYRDGSGNWKLFELSSSILSPITQSNGDQLSNPVWSYDGSYLSFSASYYFMTGKITTYMPKTYILNLIP